MFLPYADDYARVYCRLTSSLTRYPLTT